MKKIYINPDLKIVKIQTAKMIAMSIEVGEQSFQSGDAVLSRRGGNSVWDDEDEEEY